MNSFIHHTLMMLEDVGMSIRYPNIRQVTQDEDGKSTSRRSISSIIGRRVSIEQNPPMKFMMIFALLDFYVDASHPELEGQSFSQKYRNLPSQGDFDIIFRELFRVAKTIRNAIVHNSSSFHMQGGHLDVNYNFRDTNFRVNMSTDALANFYTALVMYVRGDIGKGSYFLGIMRSIYHNILFGIESFSDEFGSPLEIPSNGIKIKPYVREVFINPTYEITEGIVRFKLHGTRIPEWEGVDFYISRNGDEFLIPMEALDENLEISECDLLKQWRREGSFPQVTKS